jgi:death-on-curing protein
VIAFYGVNGRRLTLTNDEAYELVMAVVDGRMDEVADISARLGPATAPRS